MSAVAHLELGRKLSADDAWSDDAACKAADVRIFFSSDDTEQRQALELCAACPVREKCLRYAVQNGEMYGVWGGLTESDRRSMIREARRRRRERERQTDAA